MSYKSKVTGLIVGLVFAFILIFAIVGCLIASAVMNVNVICLFKHNYNDDGVCTRCGADKPVEEPVEAAEPEQANGNVIFQSTMANGLSLYATPAPLANTDAEMSFDLTANVKPLSADDKRIDWTIAWKDSNSLWAIGKDVADYATLTPASQYSQNANVTILQDFGEQIIVTATSIDNPEYFDVGTFDYVQRITGFTFNMPSISSTTTSFTYDIEYSNYTIEADISIEVSDRLILTGDETEFAVSIVDYLDGFQGVLVAGPLLTLNDNTITLSPNSALFEQKCQTYGYNINAFIPVPGFVGCFLLFDEQEAYYNGLTSGDFIAAFRYAVDLYTPDNANHASYYDVDGACNFDITYTATYDGKTYSQGTKTIEVFFDGEALHVPVEGVTLSQKHFVV